MKSLLLRFRYAGLFAGMLLVTSNINWGAIIGATFCSTMPVDITTTCRQPSFTTTFSSASSIA